MQASILFKISYYYFLDLQASIHAERGMTEKELRKKFAQSGYKAMIKKYSEAERRAWRVKGGKNHFKKKTK